MPPLLQQLLHLPPGALLLRSDASGASLKLHNFRKPRGGAAVKLGHAALALTTRCNSSTCAAAQAAATAAPAAEGHKRILTARDATLRFRKNCRRDATLRLHLATTAAHLGGLKKAPPDFAALGVVLVCLWPVIFDSISGELKLTAGTDSDGLPEVQPSSGSEAVPPEEQSGRSSLQRTFSHVPCEATASVEGSYSEAHRRHRTCCHCCCSDCGHR
mmetsp:Transcript_97678/g.176463  ORF Transcript_97678/g.176463 Transcript_97678/m.176463 type:complete len:216 (+) Transcript_97678:600-1247(+)